VLAGGADLKRQLEKLKNHPQVVVGTPGRLCELIRLRKLRMHDVKVIVADEVDQLVSAGFVADVESIIQHALRDRQLLFFSATIDGNVRKLAGKWMRDPLEIAIAAETKTVTTLKQYALMTDERDKIDDVRRLLHALKPRSALVFANDAHELGEMVAKWQYAGLAVDAIYSGQGQMERADVMRKFREGKLSILVATDVAARGLDFADLDLVINYDLPETEEHYLHRVGRTARMGRSGTAVTFVCSYERKKLARLGRRILASIEERKLVRGQLRTVSSKEK
jgi:superfamily II DNA/RNA helicase